MARAELPEGVTLFTAAAIASGTHRGIRGRYAPGALPDTLPATRTGDVEALARHFGGETAGKLGRPVEVPDDFLAALGAHDWSGNVRELANAVALAVQLSEDGVLRIEDLPRREMEAKEMPSSAPVADSTTPPTLAEVEKEHIRRVLEITNGQCAEAARLLGIHRNTLIRKIRSYGLCVHHSGALKWCTCTGIGRPRLRADM